MKLSRSKALLFSVIPTIVLLLLLVAAEIILQFGFSSNTSLFIPKTINGKEWLEVNRNYLRKYFPPGSPLIPELKPALIRKQKMPQTIRIFCLGESSMFGVPYNMAANIPAILRKQLRHLYPEKDLEVLNLGASAINTNVILDLSKELVKYQPDVVLIYTGHNEFYGPEGVGAGWFQRTFDWAIPLTYRLRELNLVQWLVTLIGGSPSESHELNLMKQVSQGNQVDLETPESRRIFSLFESNLKAIADCFKGHGVPIIVSDVSSNLEFPPFVSRNSGPDSSHAQFQYTLGLSLLKLRQTHEALRHLRMARDLDLLKFRAPTEINAIIRRVCSEQEIGFVSSDSLLAMKSKHGIPGEEYFWEHLHPNVKGYYEIASLFLEGMRRQHIPPFEKSPSDFQKSTIVYNSDSLSIPWLDLAYGDLSIRALTSKWPFNNYKRPAWVIDSASAALQQIVLSAYNRTMLWDEACLKSAEQFWKNGNTKAAVTTYEALLEEFEENFYVHYLLGNLMSTSGHVEEAIIHLQRSIHLKSDYPNARLDLGLLEINRGNFDVAIALLDEALKTTGKPEFRSLRANVYYGLAAAYANKGEFPRAVASADEALRLIPTYRDALKLKASIQQQALH